MQFTYLLGVKHKLPFVSVCRLLFAEGQVFNYERDFSENESSVTIYFIEHGATASPSGFMYTEQIKKDATLPRI